MSTALHRDELLERASKQTGLDDYGDLPFLEPLDVLIESMNRDAKVEGALFDLAEQTLCGVLAKRLVLVRDRATYPQIAAEVVCDPIFIVGMPRSGSTHLHALLSCVDGVRAPQLWEMSA